MLERMRCPRFGRGRAGQAIVETALLFPLLCLLILGSVDLGQVFYYSLGITNAAREGARHGTVYDPVTTSNKWDNFADVWTAVRTEASNQGGTLNLIYPPPLSPSHCITGPGGIPNPPYPDAYYPTAANTGYVFICFNEQEAATTAAPGQTVRVTILYNFTPVSPLVASFSGNIHVQATTTMVVQGTA